MGNPQIAASTTADLDWDLKGLTWTLAFEYRVASQPGFAVDLRVGVKDLPRYPIGQPPRG